MLFINTLNAPFITHKLGSATKSFSNIVMTGEMIENAIRRCKIETRDSTKRLAPRKRENEVNNPSTYSKGHSKSLIVNQLKTVTVNHQNTPRQEADTKTNTERIRFTPIPMMYRELYQNLFDAHVVSPFYLEPINLLFLNGTTQMLSASTILF